MPLGSVTDSFTQWVGPDPNHIATKVTTSTDKDGKTTVATITKGVEVSKAPDGGLEIVISPRVKLRLEELAKQVNHCAKKIRRRLAYGHRRVRRAEPACDLADFILRFCSDPELRSSAAEPITDQMWQIGSGFSGDPAAESGWEGDGGVHPEGTDTGVFSDNKLGFFEGKTDGDASKTEETMLISTAEEAVALGKLLSEDDAAANSLTFGECTLTAASFAAFAWFFLAAGEPLPLINTIPPEDIQTVTRTA